MVVAIWILSILLALAIFIIIGAFASWQKEADKRKKESAEWDEERKFLREDSEYWREEWRRQKSRVEWLEQADHVTMQPVDLRPNPSAQYRTFAELAFRLHPDLEEAFGYPKKTTDKATGEVTFLLARNDHPVNFDKVENFLRLEKDAAEYTKFKEILNG